MATILTKKKDTSGAPSAGDLTNDTGGAELAVNTADKRLYTKDSGGNVVEIGINPTSITTGTLNTSGAVVFNDAGADVDFRVESDTDANAFFLDGATGSIGMGTNSPLSSAGYTALTLNNATNSGYVVLQSNGTTVSDWYSSGGTTATLRGVSQPLSLQATGANYISASTNGSERLRIDSSGNVGIGTTSTAGYKMLLSDGTTSTAVHAGGGATYFGSVSSHPVLFISGNSERARITSGGYFKASNTGSYLNAAGNYHELIGNGADGTAVLKSTATTGNVFGLVMQFSRTPNDTTSWFIDGSDTTNSKFTIYSSGTITNRTGTYNAYSDIKLKQDIVDASSQWDDIKALRVVKYRLKDEVAADPNYPAYIGLVAQEVEQVSAGLVDDCPDFENVEVPVLDDDGNPVLDDEGNPQVTTERQATGTVTKSVKYSILYMKAVKALQEAMERIETLEAKVAALENA